MASEPKTETKRAIALVNEAGQTVSSSAANGTGAGEEDR
jgi:hypothetical protein